jgi:hypothetical protein
LELRAHGHVRQKLEIQKPGYYINGKVTEILKRFNNCDIQILSPRTLLDS